MIQELTLLTLDQLMKARIKLLFQNIEEFPILSTVIYKIFLNYYNTNKMILNCTQSEQKLLLGHPPLYLVICRIKRFSFQLHLYKYQLKEETECIAIQSNFILMLLQEIQILTRSYYLTLLKEFTVIYKIFMKTTFQSLLL